MKLLGFVSKAIKLLLTELVGQCRNILPLAFSRIDLPSVGQYGKGCGQYIPALTSHSVNKSILFVNPGHPRNACKCLLPSINIIFSTVH